jgi:FAD/FMN-containing dehydrogenase
MYSNSIKYTGDRFMKFIENIRNEFPEDRLTWQKGVPTFHPESVNETAKLFAMAGRLRQELYITGFGNNITPVGEEFDGIVVVKSDRMGRLLDVAAKDLYAVVGAGYPLRELNKNLAKYGLFLPHADLPYVGSVGGALAVGLSARRNDDPHPLSIGKFFIMAEIATPDGNVINPGSACFKSVSGLDIVKIFSPSWGLLGMITAATFRILPVTARDEYPGFTQESIEYGQFAKLYREPGDNQSAQYSIKIKNKFDPEGILPLIV